MTKPTDLDLPGAEKEVMHRVSMGNPVHLCVNATHTKCDYAICNDCKPETRRIRGQVHKAEQELRRLDGWCKEHHADDLMCITNADTFTPTYYRMVQKRNGRYPVRCAGAGCMKKFIAVDEVAAI
jgi:hypothetical protein